MSLESSALAGGFFTTLPPGKTNALAPALEILVCCVQRTTQASEDRRSYVADSRLQQSLRTTAVDTWDLLHAPATERSVSMFAHLGID